MVSVKIISGSLDFQLAFAKTCALLLEGPGHWQTIKSPWVMDNSVASKQAVSWFCLLPFSLSAFRLL